MREGKGAQFLFVSVSVILILSFLGTAVVNADDSVPPPSSEDELTSPPNSDVLDTPEVDAYLPSSSDDILETPEAEQQNITDEAVSLMQLQEQLPENTSVVVVIDEQIEPLVTQQATNAFVVGDPIWCPAGASPIPGAGGCTASYASLLDLVDDIENLVITEPAADGTVWIMDGADASGSDVIFDGTPAGFLAWRNFQLTLQGGWDGSPAGTIVGNSSFSVPIYILDWGASITINNIAINNTGSTGLEIDTSGDVILDTVTSLGNNVSGLYVEADGSISANNVIASDNNASGAELISGSNFTLTGTNVFDGNDDVGLYVDSGGSISAENLSASGNGDTGAELISSGDVILSGANGFGNNTGTGLYVESAGDIGVENASASGNGLYGAELIGSNGNVSMTGTNVFNDNYYSGLYVEAGGGDVSVEGITASNNGTSGTYGGGAEFTILNRFILSGVNVFNDNHNTGLFVEAVGHINAENVTASGNGAGGVYGSGAEFYSLTGKIALAGINAFNANYSDGLYVDVNGAISISGTNAIGNGGNGMAFDGNASASVVCGVIAGNSQLAIDTGIPGTLTLYGVKFDGTADDNIGISEDKLILVSNNCFKYPGGGGGGGWQSTEEELAIRYVTLDNGEPFGLNCIYYQGTYVVLINGDGVYVPCPIADSVQLTRMALADLPGSLLSDEYVSGMDVLITKNGLPVKGLDGSRIVWYVNPDSYAGYEAAYWNGQFWDDITDEIHPFMTIFFLIPEAAKDSDLAIVYWDGTEWVELSNGLHLGNGRIVKQVDKDADGSYFKADVNFIGIFVLVQK